jgi:hypothetical protein
MFTLTENREYNSTKVHANLVEICELTNRGFTNPTANLGETNDEDELIPDDIDDSVDTIFEEDEDEYSISTIGVVVSIAYGVIRLIGLLDVFLG